MPYDVSTLHHIAQLRERHGFFEVELDRIARPLAEGELARFGPVDMNYRQLDRARTHFVSLSTDAVAAAAGPAAGEALSRYMSAFAGIEDDYGRLSGPDRTAAQASELQDRLAAVAVEAKAALMDYWREVGGIEPPSDDDHMRDVRRRLDERKASPQERPEAVPGSGVPKLRLPFEGGETARRARTAVGYGFGRLLLVHCWVAAKGRDVNLPAALSDATAVSAFLGASAAVLERRCAAGDKDIAAVVGGLADAARDLREALEDMLVERARPDADWEPVRAMSLGCAKAATAAVRRVEAITAARGLATDPDGEPVPGPRP